MSSSLPSWASEVIARYASGSAGCFVLHGNVHDRMFLPHGTRKLGTLETFLAEVMVPQFDVVLTYDLGQGIRVERGKEEFSKWPGLKDSPYPTQPVRAIRFLNLYLIYVRNLQRLNVEAPKVAVIIKGAELICPNLPTALNYDLHGLASVWQSWASEVEMEQYGQAAFLISENLNTLHPLVARHPAMSTVEIPLPAESELTGVLEHLAVECPIALQDHRERLPWVAGRLTGASVSAVEELLRRRHYEAEPLQDADFSQLKKELVERDCGGLIDFVEPSRTLDDVVGMEVVKTWLREDLELWRRDELAAMPMGYLFCGPVGTGKTYVAKCLAGEAGVPVVVIKNFRDRWVGSTEANLEKIFSLLHALGRCMVFVDEADQALGSRSGGSGDSGVSSRVYSMMAQEMSNPANRGKFVWILASSRPDLIEVDLKRPGRVDVKIPIFPVMDLEGKKALLGALCQKLGLTLPEEVWLESEGLLPSLLTAGGAEALAVKTLRQVKASGASPGKALRKVLESAVPPIPAEVLISQMELAVNETTEKSFIPPAVIDLISK